MRNWLKTRNELSLWSGRALKQVAEVFLFPEHENKATWTIYLPHAQSVLSFQEYSSEFEESQRDLLFNVGECFRISGKYKEAGCMNRGALELRDKALGQEHPDTLSSMNNLALVLVMQGKYTEAEQMLPRALELREKVLGQEHPDTLSNMDNLAAVLNS
jgi:tetratricopeptide (TPR) repeat protein